MQLLPLSSVAGWRSRHFTAVTALGPQEVELEHSKVVQKRPFVRNSVCSQFLEGLFAILAQCSQFCLRSF